MVSLKNNIKEHENCKSAKKLHSKTKQQYISEKWCHSWELVTWVVHTQGPQLSFGASFMRFRRKRRSDVKRCDGSGSWLWLTGLDYLSLCVWVWFESYECPIMHSYVVVKRASPPLLEPHWEVSVCPVAQASKTILAQITLSFSISGVSLEHICRGLVLAPT